MIDSIATTGTIKRIFRLENVRTEYIDYVVELPIGTSVSEDELCEFAKDLEYYDWVEQSEELSGQWEVEVDDTHVSDIIVSPDGEIKVTEN